MEVKLKYQNALRAEVSGFSESIRGKIEKGMKEHSLVSEVLQEWEGIVNRVAKIAVGEKVILCGRSATWWDSEIKERIALRWELYKKVISGREKLTVWNEIVEKVNVDFDGSRKEFWAFVGRRTKCKKRNIASLKNEAGVSVSSTKGKLEAFHKHYEHLGRVSIDSDFDSNWKELVESKVSMCGRVSKCE